MVKGDRNAVNPIRLSLKIRLKKHTEKKISRVVSRKRVSHSFQLRKPLDIDEIDCEQQARIFE